MSKQTPSTTALKTPLPATLLELRFEAARRLGCEVVPLDPDTGYLNEIRRGKTRRVLVGGLSSLNDAVAARLVGDKFHALTVLKSRGIRVPASVRCLKPDHFRNNDYAHLSGFGPGLSFAEQHGFPLVVKPNFGSRGLDIASVQNERELKEAIEQVWKRDYLAVVQERVVGFDLRIDFLDDQYLFGYTRSPVRLSGDGRSTLRELFTGEDSRFDGPSFEEHLMNDDIWQREAGHQGLTLDTVLPKGELLDFDTPILNLNRLCVGRRLEQLAEPWARLGIAIGRIFSMRHFGIDLKIQSLDQDPAQATVIEVNSSPSLSHMSRMGHLEAALQAEMRIVEAILEATPPALDL